MAKNVSVEKYGYSIVHEHFGLSDCVGFSDYVSGISLLGWQVQAIIDPYEEYGFLGACDLLRV